MAHPFCRILCLKEWDRTLCTGIQQCPKIIALWKDQISGKFIQDYFISYKTPQRKKHIYIYVYMYYHLSSVYENVY